MFIFAAYRPRRRPGLTPLIDVVFLLLVFFMLAAQFGRDMALPLAGGGGAGDYAGPPRLVTVLPDGLRLNGVEQAEAKLVAAIVDLTETPEDIIVLRPEDGADVQRLTRVIERLAAAGFVNLVLAE
ncbi:biopolymer transporter ExbD [Roseovarius sp. SCSIO 43702]|uniref:ExbD/TolR family protein n=1 Tax=Roseovarius sp. SCSIO 43702 TaxID=2823043 RepID=UPI001C7326DC|nr:biopolymer transporter ExbD [Roseovarius sp. SCSIO 43702]QYX55703.1 biopolymer transporter ExbD [Roseovarius sp. SCSIO 43702]